MSDICALVAPMAPRWARWLSVAVLAIIFSAIAFIGVAAWLDSRRGRR